MLVIKTIKLFGDFTSLVRLFPKIRFCENSNEAIDLLEWKKKKRKENVGLPYVKIK